MKKNGKILAVLAIALALCFGFADNAVFFAGPECVMGSELAEVSETDGLVPATSKKPGRVTLKKVQKHVPYATIRWKPVKKNCTTYEIYISRSKKFPADQRIVQQCPKRDHEITLALGNSGTFYVKVRAINYASDHTYYGKFSKVKKIIMK